MRVCRWAWFVLSGGLLSCEGAQVSNQGSYLFLPNAPVVDTGPLPLEHLLIIEQDELSDQTLFYYFSGDLGPAGLGLQDLRRVEAGHGSFRWRFDVPLAEYGTWLGPAGAAGGGGAGGHSGALAAGEAGSAGEEGSWPDADSLARALEMSVGDRLVRLIPLDGSSLARVGASRFVSTLNSGQWSIEAHFGVLSTAGTVGKLRLDLGGEVLSYTPRVLPLSAFEVPMQDMLALRHRTEGAVDYCEVDLFQKLTRISDDLPVETIVRSSVRPNAPVEYTEELLSTSAGINCWSAKRRIWARVSQVARDYERRRQGDFAVDHRRLEAREVSGGLGRSLEGGVSYPGYCTLYH